MIFERKGLVILAVIFCAIRAQAASSVDKPGQGCPASELSHLVKIEKTVEDCCEGLSLASDHPQFGTSALSAETDNVENEVSEWAGKPCYLPDISQDQMISNMKQSPYHPPSVKKCNGEAATPADWIAVDILARTLTAEIGGLSECVSGFSAGNIEAVGAVILNRAKAVAAGEQKYNRDRPLRSGENPIVAVALDVKQFTSWKQGNPARQWAACPNTKPDQKFYDKRCKRTGSASWKTGGPSFMDWTVVRQVATEMVFCERSFHEKVKKLDGIYQYTAGKQMHDSRKCEEYTRVDDVVLDKTPIKDPKCVELWKPPANEEKMKKEEAVAYRARVAKCLKKL